jgi:hypothetical protein
MDARHTPDRRVVTLVPQRRSPLRVLRDLWLSHEYRRRLADMCVIDPRHSLDEGYVADAMARQIEEIRNLPEVVR